MENLIDLSGGDATFITEMIHMFLSQADTFIHDMDTALKNEDITTLKQIAHKYKTSAQLFQIQNLHSLLASTEAYNDFNRKPEIEKILNEIKIISDEVVKQLKEELKNY
ncbi:MAG TPA: Hpt domain-containing protein [Bacteroidales bacterium]|nr:Hpt domain-containing protein [Bacteroidales bacterium]HPS17870.1 Hpt domain-containing protein [Bacteroidales bacterium]